MKAIFVFLVLLVVAESIMSAPNKMASLNETDSYSLMFEGVTYTYYTTHLTFDAAETQCRRTGYSGHLVSVHSHSLNLFLLHMVKHFTTTVTQIWIGGKRERYSNRFHWTDGSRWNYWHWGSGSPSNSRYYRVCVFMSTKNTGYWHDWNCSLRRPFVCEHWREITPMWSIFLFAWLACCVLGHMICFCSFKKDIFISFLREARLYWIIKIQVIIVMLLFTDSLSMTELGN